MSPKTSASILHSYWTPQCCEVHNIQTFFMKLVGESPSENYPAWSVSTLEHLCHDPRSNKFCTQKMMCTSLVSRPPSKEERRFGGSGYELHSHYPSLSFFVSLPSPSGLPDPPCSTAGVLSPGSSGTGTLPNLSGHQLHPNCMWATHLITCLWTLRTNSVDDGTLTELVALFPDCSRLQLFHHLQEVSLPVRIWNHYHKCQGYWHQSLVSTTVQYAKMEGGAWEILCAVMSSKQRVDTREWCPIVVTHRLCVDQPRIYQTISCIVFAFWTFWSLVLGQDTRKKGLEILCRVPPPMFLPISASYHRAHNCWYSWQSCHTS